MVARANLTFEALGLAALVFVLDQASKWVIVHSVMNDRAAVIELTGFFNLVLVHNTGVSFGLGAGSAVWILVGISLAIVAGLLVWLRSQDRRWPSWAIGLVVGGALGNVIDRLHAPGVVDFLDFHVAGWHWPAFNLADSAITIGVAMLVIDGLFLERSHAKTLETRGNGPSE